MTTQTSAPATDSIAAELRAEVARQKVSQAVLSDRTGVPQATISRWLRGRGLDFDGVRALASALGVDALEILRRADFRCTLPLAASPGVYAGQRGSRPGGTPTVVPPRREARCA